MAESGPNITQARERLVKAYNNGDITRDTLGRGQAKLDDISSGKKIMGVRTNRGNRQQRINTVVDLYTNEKKLSKQQIAKHNAAFAQRTPSNPEAHSKSLSKMSDAEFDQFKKDLEKPKRKRAPWTKMPGMSMVGGGGKK